MYRQVCDTYERHAYQRIKVLNQKMFEAVRRYLSESTTMLISAEREVAAALVVAGRATARALRLTTHKTRFPK